MGEHILVPTGGEMSSLFGENEVYPLSSSPYNLTTLPDTEVDPPSAPHFPGSEAVTRPPSVLGCREMPGKDHRAKPSLPRSSIGQDVFRSLETGGFTRFLGNDTPYLRHPGGVCGCFHFQAAVGSTSWRICRLPGSVGRDRLGGPRAARAGTCPRGDFSRRREDTWRAEGGWVVASNPTPMGGSRKAVGCRINGNRADLGFLLLCSAAWSQHRSDGPGWRICYSSSGLMVLHPWPSS